MIATALLLAATLSAPEAPPVARDGFYYEQTTLVRRAGSAPLPGVRSRVWHAGRRLRLEAADPGSTALVLRLDEGRALRLDPESRIATELDLERLRARSASDASVAAGLMGAPAEDELRRAKLRGTRTIAGYSCEGYRISGRSLTLDAWVAAEVPLRAAAFADFLEWSGAAQALGGLVEAVRALPGFPLETRVRVSVLGEPQETVSTVTLVRVGPQPAERFEVPAGWSVVKPQP
jgi:hypothetical protein